MGHRKGWRTCLRSQGTCPAGLRLPVVAAYPRSKVKGQRSRCPRAEVKRRAWTDEIESDFVERLVRQRVFTGPGRACRCQHRTWPRSALLIAVGAYLMSVPCATARSHTRQSRPSADGLGQYGTAMYALIGAYIGAYVVAYVGAYDLIEA
eukprot:1966392-Rhodomonas_salina.1